VSQTERDVRAASAELDALTTLDRQTLIGRLGTSTQHGISVRVERIGADLFDVGIAAADSTAPLLRTVLYRPDTAHVTP
jgi:hypothetical protein